MDKTNEPFEPKPPQEEILRAINTFQCLTVEQVGEYLERRSLTRIRELLAELVREEYIQRVYAYRNTPTGSTPGIFYLATKGIRYLESLGQEVREHRARLSFNRERKPKPSLHTLCVNDFLISARRLEKAREDIHIFDLRHEWEYKNEPIVVKPVRIVGDIMREETVSLSPDAYIDFRLGRGREQVCVFLEMDLDTENAKQIRRKIAAYVHFIKKYRDAQGKYVSQYQTLYGTDAVSIIFPTTSEFHREALREYTRRELISSKEPDYIADLFLFTHLPQRVDPKGKRREGLQVEPTRTFLEPVWYPPFGNTPVSLLG